jgi:DNA-binding XRE family transcriptional regulator
METKLTKFQVLDALRRHADESQTACAKRLKVSRTSLRSWEQDESKITDRYWTKILVSYGTNEDEARNIAGGLPVLQLSVAAQENLRRNTAAAVAPDNSERDPNTRLPGEARWWRTEPLFWGKGQPFPPEGAKVYSFGASLVLAILDARDQKGLPTTVEDLKTSWANYWRAKTLNEDQSRAVAQMEKFVLEVLMEDGDVLLESGELVLADHVYESCLFMAQGDPRLPSHPYSGKDNHGPEYVTFENRYPVLEDLLDDSELV